jgi:hypothetical protein
LRVILFSYQFLRRRFSRACDVPDLDRLGGAGPSGFDCDQLVRATIRLAPTSGPAAVASRSPLLKGGLPARYCDVFPARHAFMTSPSNGADAKLVSDGLDTGGDAILLASMLEVQRLFEAYQKKILGILD